MNFYHKGDFCPYPWHFKTSPDQLVENTVLPIEWVKNEPSLLENALPLGVRLSSVDHVIDLQSINYQSLSVIEIEFPAFTDGRGYSQAYRLVNDLHYQNMIVAVGDVLLDQIGFMRRCGINGFLFAKPYSLQAIEAAFSRFDYFLQDQLLSQ